MDRTNEVTAITEVILLKNEVIPYKEHIRKIVEAATIHESNKFNERMAVAQVFKENPRLKSATPRWIKISFTTFVIFILSILYTYLFIWRI